MIYDRLINKIIALGQSTSIKDQLKALHYLNRNIFPYGKCVDVKIIPKLLPTIINFFSSKNQKIKSAAAYCCTVITNNGKEIIHFVVEIGGITQLIKILTSPSTRSSIKEEALRSLGNIAVDFPEEVFESGILQPLIKCLKSNSKNNILYEAIRLLNNISNKCDKNLHHLIIESGGIETLIKISAASNSKICKKALKALKNFIYCNSKNCRQHVSNAIETFLNGNHKINSLIVAEIIEKMISDSEQQINENNNYINDNNDFKPYTISPQSVLNECVVDDDEDERESHFYVETESYKRRRQHLLTDVKAENSNAENEKQSNISMTQTETTDDERDGESNSVSSPVDTVSACDSIITTDDEFLSNVNCSSRNSSRIPSATPTDDEITVYNYSNITSTLRKHSPPPSVIELFLPEALTASATFYNPSGFFFASGCKLLGLKFDKDNCNEFLRKIKFTEVKSSSKPATYFPTNDTSGFSCFSIIFSGIDDSVNTFITKTEINKNFYRKNYMEIDVKTMEGIIFSSILKDEHILFIVEWFKCRIMLYCNGFWQRFGNFGSEDIPLFLLEKDIVEEQVRYKIILSLTD